MKNKFNFYHYLAYNKCSQINKVAIIYNYLLMKKQIS